ncbi:MAG: hypothetical protein EOP06_14020 [Proteobacteria bacterium]|nr:MAG: hypothetical protein EOP06_14020 [Pseudomonadota bacterium]
MRREIRERDLFGDVSGIGGEDLRTARRQQRLSESAAIVLTGRDFEVLKFISEMKFASSTEIFEKFFKITRDQKEAASESWTKKRLLQLERAGFLKSTYTFSESTRYFVVTFRSYYALKNYYPHEEIPKPLLTIDIRTFVHDRALLTLRLRLEREEAACGWISDRVLRSGLDRSFGFSSKYVPDGLYEKVCGDKVAVELEIAQKTKQRYRGKVAFYVSLLRSEASKLSGLKQVRFICLKKPCFEAIKKETRMFGSLFQVELEVSTADEGDLA